RAAVRIASLNMNGGASHKTDVKWEKINQLIRDRGIGVLALQETHLTEARANDLKACYPRLHIVNTAHPTHDSSRDGVAVILNKYTTNWADSTTKTIIAGKALLLSLACKNDRKLHILCVYAPSGSDALNAGFWQDLDKIWHDDRSLPRLDLLLGDFNMVESREDRLPSHADTAAVVNALTKFRERHTLVDGWRQENMGVRDFTFATQHVSQQNSHSRIDRIYLRPTLLDSAREWIIQTSGIPKLDHDVVSVQIAPEGTPTMGNGRQTLPQFILDDKDAFTQIAELAKSRQTRIATGLQVEWALLKKDILALGNTLARKKMANLNKNLNRWKKRRKVTLLGVAQGTIPVAESIRQLDEINAAIRKIEETKTLRMREKVAARHHLEGETNSQYDYQLNRLQRPRDTIDSLQIPHTEPPQYTLNSKQMAEIATQHHDSLQRSGDEDRPANDPLTEARIEDALSVLKPRVMGSMVDKLSEPISDDEIRNALKQVPNRKAPGLDGLPVELWKKLDLEFCEAAKTGSEAFNVVGALRAVINDIELNGVTPGTGFADGWLCPIYKKKARTDISNYRPITVLNTDYKTMTKCLTNRL
ncbi:Endonuclease/exonuclease/phosphatase, partial [Ephemerocybe angulata]